jgi:GMP synthase-like glutamine amidotransferase
VSIGIAQGSVDYLEPDRAFIAFQVASTPVSFWFGTQKVLDVAVGEEAKGQINFADLVGGIVGPKPFSREFLEHHPDEAKISDGAITVTAGQLLDQLHKRKAITGKEGVVDLHIIGAGKKEVLERFARMRAGYFDRNDPMSALWLIPRQVRLRVTRDAVPGEELLKRLEAFGMTVEVYDTPQQLGEAAARDLLEEWQERVDAGHSYVLNLVTGTTPEKALLDKGEQANALIRQFRSLPRERRAQLAKKLILWIPDDHVIKKDSAWENLPETHPKSAKATRVRDFLTPFNEALSPEEQITEEQIRFPQVGQQAAKDLEEIPGIDRAVMTFGLEHIYMHFAGESAHSLWTFGPNQLIEQPLGLSGKPRVLVIQNSEEADGGLGDLPGFQKEVIRAYKGEPIPDPAFLDWRNLVAVVVMGGPPNVYEVGTFPWVEDLFRFVQHVARRQEVPYFGICYGCQMLARALGVPVTDYEDPASPKQIREIGPSTVQLTPEGKDHPVFSGLPSSLELIELHGDAIGEIPTGATIQGLWGEPIPIVPLIWGAHGDVQGIQAGIAFGVVPHPEFNNREVAQSWLEVPQTKGDQRIIRDGKTTYQLIEQMRDEFDPERQGQIRDPILENCRQFALNQWQKRHPPTQAGVEEELTVAFRESPVLALRDGVVQGPDGRQFMLPEGLEKELPGNGVLVAASGGLEEKGNLFAGDALRLRLPSRLAAVYLTLAQMQALLARKQATAKDIFLSNAEDSSIEAIVPLLARYTADEKPATIFLGIPQLSADLSEAAIAAMALAARHHPDGYLGVQSMYYVQLANGQSFFLFA